MIQIPLIALIIGSSIFILSFILNIIYIIKYSSLKKKWYDRDLTPEFFLELDKQTAFFYANASDEQIAKFQQDVQDAMEKKKPK
jgi:hypothetical protein